MCWHLADWFEGYARYKQHALYITTNSDYGSRPPNVHTMQTMFFDRPQKFTNVGLFNFFYFFTCYSKPLKRDMDYLGSLYTVNHKKGGSTFVIITLGNLNRFL